MNRAAASQSQDDEGELVVVIVAASLSLSLSHSVTRDMHERHHVGPAQLAVEPGTESLLLLVLTAIFVGSRSRNLIPTLLYY